MTIGGPVGVDMKAVKARKDAVLGRSRIGLEAWLKGMANCTVLKLLPQELPPPEHR